MFVVLDGIDGAGKGRQRLEITDYLISKKINVESFEFPDHNGVLYKELIKPHLLEKIKISNESLFVSFALDQLLYQYKISGCKGSNSNHFISDGYFATNIVYQCLVNKIIDIKDAIKFAKIINLTIPDLNIFIDVKPEIALKRKSIEPGHNEGLDINERDLEKQYKIREGFMYLIENKIFGKWKIIDGNGSIEEVKEQIINSINF